MKYLKEYIENNVKFAAIKKGKNIFEHYFGRFLSEEKNCFYITDITFENKIYNPKINSKIELVVYTPKGAYSMVCKVLKKTEDGWKISYPLTMHYSQRREFSRMMYETEITLNITENNETRTINALTKDVCAGGISIETDFELNENQKIDLKFSLNERIIKAKGEFIYKREIEKDGKKLCHIGLAMVGLKKEDINFIIGECFKKVGSY